MPVPRREADKGLEPTARTPRLSHDVCAEHASRLPVCESPEQVLSGPVAHGHGAGYTPGVDVRRFFGVGGRTHD